MRTAAPLIALLLAPLAVPHAAEPPVQPGGSDLLARLAGYLEQHRVRAEKLVGGLDKFAETLAVIERRPDSLTSFETFICRADYASSSADLAARIREAKAAIWREGLERFQATQKMIKLIIH